MWEKVRGMREAECSCLALWVPARSALHGLLLAAAGLSADPCPLASHLISESLEPTTRRPLRPPRQPEREHVFSGRGSRVCRGDRSHSAEGPAGDRPEALAQERKERVSPSPSVGGACGPFSVAPLESGPLL